MCLVHLQNDEIEFRNDLTIENFHVNHKHFRFYAMEVNTWENICCWPWLKLLLIPLLCGWLFTLYTQCCFDYIMKYLCREALPHYTPTSYWNLENDRNCSWIGQSDLKVVVNTLIQAALMGKEKASLLYSVSQETESLEETPVWSRKMQRLSQGRYWVWESCWSWDRWKSQVSWTSVYEPGIQESFHNLDFNSGE